MSLDAAASSYSFRDPRSHVAVDGETVRRTIRTGDVVVARQIEKLCVDLASKRLVRAPRSLSVEPDGLMVVEHEPITVWNYPWEWCWSQLRDAALAQLRVIECARGHDLTLSDASSFNMTFAAGRPEFVDFGSFVQRDRAEPWWGYQQFCEQFLYPLLLTAHTGADFRASLMGGVGTIPLEQASMQLRKYKRFPGVIHHVLLPAMLSRKTDITTAVAKGVGVPVDTTERVVRSLRSLIEGLEYQLPPSTWSGYSNRTHYKDAELARKEEFVAGVVGALQPGIVLDLGCNDGKFSQVALRAGATLVIASDSDEIVVERLYRDVRDRGIEGVLPLVHDVMNPSPSLGWRGSERQSFATRVRPDLALLLAVIHHVVIGNNVPMLELALWMRSFECPIVVEVPERADEKVQHLLARKSCPGDIGYSVDLFEAAIVPHFWIDRRVSVHDTRHIYYLLPRRRE